MRFSRYFNSLKEFLLFPETSDQMLKTVRALFRETNIGASSVLLYGVGIFLKADSYSAGLEVPCSEGTPKTLYHVVPYTEPVRLGSHPHTLFFY